MEAHGDQTVASGSRKCPNVSGRNNVPSLVLEEYKWPIIGVSGRNSVSIIGVSGRNSAPSIMSVEGIVPHHWHQWEK
ncbi:unnamed protein product [Staurois parvus]|uniref:Uncharacterized protein n=1 Tax=Staurois parvus TaxID=386267 RepID=A0ABN9CMZ6_9NEOB|nr:unnamed protein product [Staurois parvus]